MPPETPPPDDARRPSPHEGNVVDPEVLAERRAQRAEQAEQSAARRAADAQVLAAQLARERARIEAERDAARAEAAAAREGADAAIAEAQHLKTERDALRAALAQARAERDALAAREAAEPGAASPARATVPAADPGSTPVPGADGPAAPPPVNGNGNGARDGFAVPLAWPAALRRELAVARAAAIGAPLPSRRLAPATALPGLAGERRLLARRAAGGAVAGVPITGAEIARERRGGRAAPVTALALERERSSRLQAQLDNSLAVQRELRTHIAALQRAVHQRVEAERRIEGALRRVREELMAANLLATGRRAAAPSTADVSADSTPPRAGAGTAAPSATPTPAPGAMPVPAPGATPVPAPGATPTPAPGAMPVPAPGATPTPAPGAMPVPASAAAPPAATPMPAADATPHSTPSPAAALRFAAAPTAPTAEAAPSAEAASGPVRPAPTGLDPFRLSAARERLRATAPVAAPLMPLPEGTPAPWLTAALQRLLASEPETAGRIAVGLVPAQGLAAERSLRYDLLLAGRGCFAVDLAPGAATVVPRAAPRPRGARDLGIVADAPGFARLLHGRRGLRRPARVRGGRRALRELRRLARAPLGLRDLGSAGVTLEPALAMRLVALAIDPEATRGERFAIAHAPLAGGPVDAWLRIADGAAPEVRERAPAEPTRLTLRSTRGALLALIAGVEPPPGEAGAYEGEDRVLALLRTWIAQTEHPAA